MMYKATEIERYAIKYAYDHDCHPNNLAIQKQLYFLQAQYLVYEGHPLFPENIVAWSTGPIILEAYNEFKGYGSAPIPKICAEGIEKRIKYKDMEIMDTVLEQVYDKTISYLVDLTCHQSPWQDYYREFSIHDCNIIPNSAIKKFFMPEKEDNKRD